MRIALPLIIALAACATPPRPPVEARGVMTGLDVLAADGFKTLKGRRVGLITNTTGVDRAGRRIVDVLGGAPGVELAAVFTPEHGFTATSESEHISSGTLVVGGRTIPLHSLYHGGIHGMRPTEEQLRRLDALVFDIQDIGARFYTYLATMGMALEEAKKLGLEFIVLDRPNPIRGDVVEGPVLEDPKLKYVTATAYFQTPVRHGMTAGEIALFHNLTVGHKSLRVVRLKGWKRSMWQDQTGLPWVPPSPNMPDLEAASLYPGVGIFEASNLAVGRGTPIPFRWVGAPWMDAEAVVARLRGTVDGVDFSVQDYTPTKSVFANELCRGVRIRVTDRDAMRPLTVFRRLALVLRELHPNDVKWRWDEARRMVGVSEFRRLWETGAEERAFMALFDKGPAEFEPVRRSVLLY